MRRKVEVDADDIAQELKEDLLYEYRHKASVAKQKMYIAQGTGSEDAEYLRGRYETLIEVVTSIEWM